MDGRYLNLIRLHLLYIYSMHVHALKSGSEKGKAAGKAKGKKMHGAASKQGRVGSVQPSPSAPAQPMGGEEDWKRRKRHERGRVSTC